MVRFPFGVGDSALKTIENVLVRIGSRCCLFIPKRMLLFLLQD